MPKKKKICFPQKVCALSLTFTTSPTVPAVMRLLCQSLYQSCTSTLVLANLGLCRASVKAVRATLERRILQLEHIVSSLLTLQHNLASPKGAKVKERFWASMCQAFAQLWVEQNNLRFDESFEYTQCGLHNFYEDCMHDWNIKGTKIKTSVKSL